MGLGFNSPNWLCVWVECMGLSETHAPTWLKHTTLHPGGFYPPHSSHGGLAHLLYGQRPEGQQSGCWERVCFLWLVTAPESLPPAPIALRSSCRPLKTGWGFDSEEALGSWSDHRSDIATLEPEHPGLDFQASQDNKIIQCDPQTHDTQLIQASHLCPMPQGTAKTPISLPI